MIKFRLLKELDFVLLAAALSLFVIGLLFIYSSSFQKETPYLLRQLIWMGLGVLIFLLLVSVPYNIIVGTAYIWYALTLLLLLLVLVSGTMGRLGAQRWLTVGGFNIQPSEFAKVTLILALASCLTMQRDSIQRWDGLFLPLLLTFIPMAMIVKQPDLGTALVLLPVLFAVLYVAGGKVKHLLVFLLIGIASAPFLWHKLAPYQKERLSVFIDPNIDPTGTGYTIIQSKIAIGSGMLWGKGWLHGTQNQLKFLPESHTDFIFPVICEEWGFLGGLLVIALFLVLVWRGFKIAQMAQEHSGRFLAAGITTMLATQIFCNIGMTIGFLPVVGIPLPLLSYGGSSLFTTMISLALLENIRLRRM